MEETKQSNQPGVSSGTDRLNRNNDSQTDANIVKSSIDKTTTQRPERNLNKEDINAQNDVKENGKSQETKPQNGKLLKRVPQLKTEMQLRTNIAYTHALNVLKVERSQNQDLDLGTKKTEKEEEREFVPYTQPSFVKNNLRYSKVYDGKIIDPDAIETKVDHGENLKRIRDYNARWRMRNRLDRAVEQTLTNLENPENKDSQEKAKEVHSIDIKMLKELQKEEAKDVQTTSTAQKDASPKSKSPKKETKKKANKNRSKTKDREKVKIEQASKAALYKKRNQILSKMPLSEALYKRLMSKHLSS